MIEAERLTKRYGPYTAISDVTFRVEPGEIVGFLGPNGAGKTTTMRMLTGYLMPTEGRAIVAGIDVAKDPLGAKRKIGYLPENPPVYGEMSIRSYLRFVCQIREVPAADREARVNEAMDRVGIGDVAGKLIGRLSKGYRQRVGLAQAIVHNPEVVILDEPTIGLDPNQIKEIRKLIRNLAGTHTVLLSTHILAEVEMTCGRVVIIHGGRVIAQGTPEELSDRVQTSREIYVQLKAAADEGERTLAGVKGVHEVRREGASARGLNGYLVISDGREDIRDAVAKAVVKAGHGLLELRPRSVALEDVFAQLTRAEKTEALPAAEPLEGAA